MDQIRSNLYLGDITDLDVRKLDAEGITAVLSCVERDELMFYAKPGAIGRPHHILRILDGEAIPFYKLTEALERLDDWLQDEKTVLVHCAAGISRSPSIIIAYLMGFGVTWDEAEKEVRKARPQIMPHTEVKKSILCYYRHWPYDGSYDEEER